MSAAAPHLSVPGRYSRVFLCALIAVSLLPALISLIHFEMLNAGWYTVTLLWSFLVFLGGAHVWITLAYYGDLRWLSQFRQHPWIFFAAPIAIVAACVALMFQHNEALGLALVYSTVVLNLWHHGKQNWGILALVGKNRKVDVRNMRFALVYAWPFFIPAVTLYFADASTFVDAEVLRSLAYACAAAYVVFAASTLWRNQSALEKDSLVLLFCVALCIYFVPLIALNGKPYALFFFGGAHAMQYYLLVLVSLSMKSWRSVELKTTGLAFVLAFLAVAGTSYAAYEILQGYGPPSLWESTSVRLVVGLVTGVNLVHFWLDAFIWKMSDRAIRELHGDAFAF